MRWSPTPRLLGFPHEGTTVDLDGNARPAAVFEEVEVGLGSRAGDIDDEERDGDGRGLLQRDDDLTRGGELTLDVAGVAEDTAGDGVADGPGRVALVGDPLVDELALLVEAGREQDRNGDEERCLR
jgi:hypothetical protein